MSPSTSPTNNSSTVLPPQNRRAVCIFGAGDQTAFLQFVATHRPENGGGFQRGIVPLGTRLLERSGKSVVCYTFCPGWRRKGAAHMAQTVSRTRKAGGGMERQQSSRRLLSGGTKGISNPRPSSPVPPQRHQRGSLRRRSFSAACSVFFARFTVSWKCAAVSGMGCSSPSEKP